MKGGGEPQPLLSLLQKQCGENEEVMDGEERLCWLQKVGGGMMVIVGIGAGLLRVRHCSSHFLCTEFLILTTTL